MSRKAIIYRAATWTGVAAALIPGIASAQNLTKIENLVKDAGGIIQILVPIAVTLALLFFIWGLAKFILAAGDEEKKAEGKRIMWWGGIALFVIVSIFGIITWIGDLLEIDQGGGVDTPYVIPVVPE